MKCNRNQVHCQI